MSENKVVKKKQIKKTTVKAKSPAVKKAKSVAAAKKTVKDSSEKVVKKASKAKTKKVAKASTKKTSSKKKQDLFDKCPAGKEFVLCNDDKVSSVLDLAEEFGNIDVHVYNHHVNSERNDFSTWLKDVFKANDLAKKIRSLDKHSARIEIYKYLIKSLKR